MLIAKEKRRENVAEYVIYMWHVEDLIRAFKLDIDLIKQRIIDGFQTDEKTAGDIREWYESLIHMMREQGIAESGHLQMVKNTIADMEEVHQRLLQSPSQNDYMRLFFQAKPNISIFKARSSNPDAKDIEICFNALYSLLLMKLSGKEISHPTQESMDTFSELLAMLSIRFKEVEDGTLDL